MRFHYDLTQASPVIREMPLYVAGSAGVVAGQALAIVEDDDAEGNGCVWPMVATTAADFIGVTTEAVDDGTSVQATGVSFYTKIIMNPLGVYMAEVDETNAFTNTVANATGEVITHAAFSANNIGAWTFCNGPAGNSADGNIFKVGAVTGTTALTNATGTAYDDELKASTTASTYLLLPSALGGGIAGGSHDLSTACTKMSCAEAPTGADILVLEHYINSKRFPLEPLRIENHGGKNDTSAKFYSDCFFPESAYFFGLD